MRNILTVAHRELRSSFTSPVAYVLVLLFLAFVGLIFVFSLNQPEPRAEMRGLFGTMAFLTLMVVPFITTVTPGNGCPLLSVTLPVT